MIKLFIPVGSAASIARFSMTGLNNSSANENLSCDLRKNKDDSGSSDLDQSQMDIVAQMHNIVNDDYSMEDSHDDTFIWQ